MYMVFLTVASIESQSKTNYPISIKFHSTLIAFLFRPLISKLGLDNNANFDQNIGNKFSDLGPVHFLQTLSSLNHKTNLNDRCNISCTLEFSFVLYLVPKNTPNFKYVQGIYLNFYSSNLGCAEAVVEGGLFSNLGSRCKYYIPINIST